MICTISSEDDVPLSSLQSADQSRQSPSACGLENISDSSTEKNGKKKSMLASSGSDRLVLLNNVITFYSGYTNIGLLSCD